MFQNRTRLTQTIRDAIAQPSWLLSVYLLAISVFSLSVAKAQPEWIWLNDQPENNQTVYFRTSFDLDHKPSSVTLHATCDNRMTAYLNGKKVLTNQN